MLDGSRWKEWLPRMVGVVKGIYDLEGITQALIKDSGTISLLDNP